jgi:regulator of ribosome biosynthesis
LVVLPNEKSILPRSAKIPEPKAETKWEKFAKEKGIKKKKRDRMVFDESNQEYRPRFGYKGANSGIEEIPIVEVKAGQDPFADPWAEARQDKKNRVKKNEKNQLKNIGRALGKSGKNKTYGMINNDRIIYVVCFYLIE